LILLGLNLLLLNEVNLILDVKYCLDLQACLIEPMYHVGICDWHPLIGGFLFILFLDPFRRYSNVNLSISVAELRLWWLSLLQAEGLSMAPKMSRFDFLYNDQRIVALFKLMRQIVANWQRLWRTSLSFASVLQLRLSTSLKRCQDI